MARCGNARFARRSAEPAGCAAPDVDRRLPRQRSEFRPSADAQARGDPPSRGVNKQIGAELGTSETTVKIHRHQVMEKMGAGSLAELVRMADKLGIVVPRS